MNSVHLLKHFYAFPFFKLVFNKSVSRSCIMQWQPIINPIKCYFGFASSPSCIYYQWNIVDLCCFLSADPRSKSQSGRNTAGSLWTSFTAVWHQPPEQTEAGPQENPWSVRALFYWEQHIPTMSLVIAGVSLRYLASSVKRKKHKSITFFSKCIALWKENVVVAANID